MNIKHIELGWSAGTINNLVESAVNVAKLHNCKVTFPFNGIKVTVDKDSDVGYIAWKTLLHVSEQRGDVE